MCWDDWLPMHPPVYIDTCGFQRNIRGRRQAVCGQGLEQREMCRPTYIPHWTVCYFIQYILYVGILLECLYKHSHISLSPSPLVLLDVVVFGLWAMQHLEMGWGFWMCCAVYPTVWLVVVRRLTNGISLAWILGLLKLVMHSKLYPVLKSVFCYAATVCGNLHGKDA